MSEKQVALLVSVVALVLAALSGSAIVIASTAQEKAQASLDAIQELREAVSKHDTHIEQLTAGMLAMAPILEAASGDVAPGEDAAQGAKRSAEADDVLAVEAPSATEVNASQQHTGGEASGTNAVAAADSVANEGGLDRAVDEVLVERIIANWVRPASAKNGMSVDIVFKMSRAGVINEAKVVQSSGDQAFDKSATDAILNVNAVTEIQELSDQTYQKLYKERRVRFSPEALTR